MYDVLALIWHAKTECRDQKFYINKFWNRLFLKLKINKVEKIKKKSKDGGKEASWSIGLGDVDADEELRRRRATAAGRAADGGLGDGDGELFSPRPGGLTDRWAQPPGTFSTSLLDPSREPNLGSLSTSSTSPNPLHSTAASPAARRLIPSPQPQVGTCQRGFSPTDSPGFLPRSPLHPCFFFLGSCLSVPDECCNGVSWLQLLQQGGMAVGGEEEKPFNFLQILCGASTPPLVCFILLLLCPWMVQSTELLDR